ncbi:MAG: gluconate 2-dehydrogenase subunit 3 family protein [Acidobacteriota bacterium]|jgi:gluconate 2-dehydrogenase gamma chain
MSSDCTRRDLLRNAALGAVLGGISDDLMAEVHLMAEFDQAASGGVYQPKAFATGEWATLRHLCDLILPADEVSRGAIEAGCPQYIDLLASGSSELAALLAGGIQWLDSMARGAHGKPFMSASPEQQTALLDRIAYRRNDSPDLAAAIRFFELLRRMTVDAFYTSKIGIADVGYMGNKGMTKFEVPVESLEHAIKRSPV